MTEPIVWTKLVPAAVNRLAQMVEQEKQGLVLSSSSSSSSAEDEELAELDTIRPEWENFLRRVVNMQMSSSLTSGCYLAVCVYFNIFFF